MFNLLGKKISQQFQPPPPVTQNDMYGANKAQSKGKPTIYINKGHTTVVIGGQEQKQGCSKPPYYEPGIDWTQYEKQAGLPISKPQTVAPQNHQYVSSPLVANSGSVSSGNPYDLGDQHCSKESAKPEVSYQSGSSGLYPSLQENYSTDQNPYQQSSNQSNPYA